MKETLKLGLVLLLVTSISGGILAFSNHLTADKIAEIEKAGSFGALVEIFGDADDFVPMEEDRLAEITGGNRFVKEVIEVYAGEELIGYAFHTISGGYGGDLAAITGISVEGEIMGIRVGENSETPNLGTRVEGPDFTDSFIGKSTENELVPVASPSADNEIQALAGATVSVEGVLAGVNGAREAFLTYLAQ